ncbi:MAG: hypothetical protein ACI9K9_000229, partial [Neolewinella sp.]
ALVGPTGVFGHHTSELFVNGLTGGYVAEYFTVGNYGCGGVVTTGFYG